MKEIVHRQKILLCLLAVAIILAGALLATTNRSKFSYKASGNDVLCAISSSTANAQVGTQITVNVSVNPQTTNNIGGVEVQMTYPSNLLAYQAGSDVVGTWPGTAAGSFYGDNGSSVVGSTGTIDKIVGSATVLSGNTATNIFQLTFNVTNAGSGAFSFVKCDVYSPSGTADVTGGTKLTANLGGAQSFTTFNQPITPTATLSPTNRTVTYKPTYTFNGSDTNISTVILTVNGTTIPTTVAGSSWNATSTASLNLGSNTIVLQGKDALNNLSNQGSFTLNRHKPADATGDGASNMPDFMAFLSAYGNISSKGQTINDGNNYLADFNESGVIDMNDFLNLLANWTHS